MRGLFLISSLSIVFAHWTCASPKPHRVINLLILPSDGRTLLCRGAYTVSWSISTVSTTRHTSLRGGVPAQDVKEPIQRDRNRRGASPELELDVTKGLSKKCSLKEHGRDGRIAPDEGRVAGCI